jgi:hypothetical protein
MLQYLYRLVGVFRNYFGEVEEETIRDNFVIIYELLDETMDHGYPQTTEAVRRTDLLLVLSSFSFFYLATQSLYSFRFHKTTTALAPLLVCDY